MIIKPDFLDHYKTRKLCNLLNEEMAPLYLIRLWGFCEMRKSAVIPDDAENIKAVCQFKGKAKKFVKVLISSGFLKKEKTEFIVHDWEQYNQGLMTSYENGRKGGRPKGKGGNPPETRGLPAGNPPGNLNAIPVNPLETVKSREDKSREDASAPEAAATTGMLAQVQRIKAIRPEFKALRDVDIENALKDCPPEFREAGINDFERDVAAALTPRDMPVKQLRSYLDVAARGGPGRSTVSVGVLGGGGRDWNDEATDTEKLVEFANQKLAEKKFLEDQANGRK